MSDILTNMDQRDERIATLEARVKELEGEPTVMTIRGRKWNIWRFVDAINGGAKTFKEAWEKAYEQSK